MYLPVFQELPVSGLALTIDFVSYISNKKVGTDNRLLYLSQVRVGTDNRLLYLSQVRVGTDNGFCEDDFHIPLHIILTRTNALLFNGKIT